MTHELDGKRIAFLAADGVEQVELSEPWMTVQMAGGEPKLISIKSGSIQGVKHDIYPGDTFTVDTLASEASVVDYDALVLPGGVANPDKLRVNPDAMAFVRDFFSAGKPIAAICHGPWSLVETGVVKGRTLTSWASLRTDIRNAGGTWVDEEVHVDRGLVTSRKPADLPAFNARILEEFRGGAHLDQSRMTAQAEQHPTP